MKVSSHQPSSPDAQLLRISDVSKLTTLSKSCIQLWVAQGRFPKPLTISATVKVWRLSQVNDWINAIEAEAAA
jgi:predicted DNA-binding transcriptional regulator AlpA